jgi:ribosome biogenesis protein Tsr3
MARAAAAVTEVESSGMKRRKQADIAARRDRSVSLPFLVAKNLLFWGTILLSLYGLYAVVAAI